MTTTIDTLLKTMGGRYRPRDEIDPRHRNALDYIWRANCKFVANGESIAPVVLGIVFDGELIKRVYANDVSSLMNDDDGKDALRAGIDALVAGRKFGLIVHVGEGWLTPVPLGYSVAEVTVIPVEQRNSKIEAVSYALYEPGVSLIAYAPFAANPRALGPWVVLDASNEGRFGAPPQEPAK